MHNWKSINSVCNLCGSQDFTEIFQDESQELSWITEDIAVLCEENSNILTKIRKLNRELENLDKKFQFYEETIEDDVCESEASRYSQC